MTEPEVSLRIAMQYVQNGESREDVTVSIDGQKVETGIRKMGAILGDFAEIGCNSVLNPGTVVGKNSNIYPTSMVRGVIPANSIYKKQGEVAGKVID